MFWHQSLWYSFTVDDNCTFPNKTRLPSLTSTVAACLLKPYITSYLVWRREHETVVLLRLHQTPQCFELVNLGEHALSGQQHVNVPALVQNLADGGDGAVQLGQTLVQFLHLQVQRLGLQLPDLLQLREGGEEGDLFK